MSGYDIVCALTKVGGGLNAPIRLSKPDEHNIISGTRTDPPSDVAATTRITAVYIYYFLQEGGAKNDTHAWL